MTGEFIGNDEPQLAVVDHGYVYERLKLLLAFYEHPASNQLRSVLETAERPVLVPEVVAGADIRLQECAEETARLRADKVAEAVLAVYPDDFLSESLITPRQYIRSNNLEPNRRHLLTQAKVSVVDKSTQELRTAMHEDEQEYQQYDHGINDATLHDGVNKAVGELQAEVDMLLDGLNAEMPDSVLRFKRMIEHLESIGLPLGIGYCGEDGRNYSINRANVNRMLGDLTEILTGLSAGPELVIGRLVQRFRGQVESNVEQYLKDRYERLASIAADQRLPILLNKAYAKVAGQEYAYVSLREQERQESSMPQVTLELPVQEAPKVANGDFEIDSIGTVQSPFAWLPDTKVSMQLVSAGGEHMLFCEALGSTAQSITNALRREAATRKTFDSLRERFLRIEITDPNGRHPHIQRLHGSLNQDYQDLIIHKFGNIGANAKTNVERYAEIAELARDYGLPETTTLLILVGETDKANQLKLFGSFGIDRATARSQNAGSV